MLQTINVILEPSGKVRFPEPVQICTPVQALLFIEEFAPCAWGDMPTSSLHFGSDQVLSAHRCGVDEFDAQNEQELEIWKYHWD